MSLPGVAAGPPPATAEVVIVGAGIQGLSLAYELGRRGFRDVVVLDRSWPGSGASTRNGEMIRSAFASPEWTGLFDVALRRWHVLADELGAPTGFTAAGYLLLATTDEEAERLAGYAERHRQYGLATRLLDADETLAAAPALAPDQVRAGLLQADGGYGDHNLALFAFAAAAGRGGAGVHPYVEATAIRVDGGRVTGVETTAGPISTPRVVLAAGPSTPRLAALAGLEVGTRTVHLEAIATERLEPFLGPALAMLHVLGYGHQTPRGEFVGGTEQTEMARTEDVESNLYYLRDIAQKFVRVLPRLAGARLVRHWGGLLDTAPDMAPVLGPTEIDGLVLDAGWTYGFVGAPAGGLLLAEYLATGQVPPPLAPFLPERLVSGRFIEEGSLVVVPET